MEALGVYIYASGCLRVKVHDTVNERFIVAVEIMSEDFCQIINFRSVCIN
jgi:hypothetical protein